MDNKIDWAEYYEYTRNKPPHSLLVESIEHIKEKDQALDIGGGALSDAKFLLGLGFTVKVIDNSPLLEAEANKLNNFKLDTEIIPLENFVFPENKYDLVSAMFVLNYCNKDNFDLAFKKIHNSLKVGGIFCGLLFGVNSKLSNSENNTYPSKSQILESLSIFETIKFAEKNKGEVDPKNELMTSAHIFMSIVRK